jgi:signal transduction histidine kinase
MTDFFRHFFEATGFLPHGQSYLWRSDILATNILGDALTALAFFSIAPMLYYLTRKRSDLAYKPVYSLFALFILACGATKLIEILTIWEPVYRVQGAIKVITGLLSLGTAIVLLRSLPKILSFPSHARLEVANARLLAEISERERAQVALRQANEALEGRVQQRTAQLIKINRELEHEIETRKQTEVSLMNKNLELVRINSDLDNFVYCASHDLKAPIVNIEGLVTALKEEIPQRSEPVEEILHRLDGSLVKVDRTILDLTEVSRLQKTNGHEEKKEIRFANVLAEVEQNIQDLINENKAVIKADFSGAETVSFSPQNLHSILYNLLSNAVKYHPENRTPEIEITSGVQGDCVVLSVKDNGIGIDLPRHEKKIFSLFRRLNDQIEGSGIGLYIVKRIADNNKCRINVKSAVGQGSTFEVFFPNVKPPRNAY